MPRYSDWRFPRYVPVEEKRVKARNTLAQLRKKNPRIQPVVIEGSRLARNWWGIAWNRNLERYADYSNRIGRGRSYVRHGAVLDLRIEPGRVTALVQGSRAKPYQVEVRIRALDPKAWQAITRACAGGFDSVQTLLAGRFPEALAELFTAPGQGLFPTPEEIDFDCSCPDWADMCKHVAAVLYGIGARLDEDPSLFFELRRVKMLDLIGEAVRAASDELLERAEGPSGPVIADADIADVFGIVMEDTPDFGHGPLPPAGKAAAVSRKPARKPAARQALAAGQPRGDRGGDEKRLLDRVLAAAEGIDVPTLVRQTGIGAAEVRKVVYAARRKGLIVRVARGVFRGPQPRRDPREEAGAVMACIARYPAGAGAAQVKADTGLADARVRAILAKALRDGALKRVARGVYALAGQRGKAPVLTRQVLDAVGQSPRGATVAAIREKTGLDERQIRNILFRLLRSGRLRRSGRGVYQAV